MIKCLRCGVCCTKYQVRLSLMDARRIADEMALPFDEWLERYTDKHWQRPDCFLLRKHEGSCVFLEHAEDSDRTYCTIQDYKPLSCQEWTPGMYRKECREGLARYWNLKVNDLGQLEGAEDHIRAFHSYLELLSLPNEQAHKCAI